MESLTEILLYKDLENRIKKIKTRTKNYVKYDDQISKFSYLLDFTGDFPILSNSEYNNKICFIDWILKESMVYLNLNCVYLNGGMLAYLECLTKEGKLAIINNDGNLRTFDGRKFKKQIDLESIDKVDVFLVDKFLIRR